VVFLAHLTDNPVILGMPMALWMGGFWLSQLWVSGWVQRQERSMPLYRVTSLIRGFAWLALVFVAATTSSSITLIVTFLLFLLIYPLIWGIGGLAFLEIVGKVVPPRIRGQFFSWRLTLGGILAIGGGWFVNHVLEDSYFLKFPRNFALIFSVAAVVSILGTLVFHFIKEPVSEHRPAPGTGLRGRWDEIREVLSSDAQYRGYLMARVSLLVAAGTAPLIIVYAQRRFGVPLATAAIFLVADTITGLVAVAVAGSLSVRKGDRWLGLVATSIGSTVFVMICIAETIGLPAGIASIYFLVVFVLLAIFNGASAISMFALNMNIAPADRRPLYLGLGNTILGMASYATMLQGLLVPFIGYRGLFFLAALLMGHSLYRITRLFEPTRAEA
jgi:MFS family permease